MQEPVVTANRHLKRFFPSFIITPQPISTACVHSKTSSSRKATHSVGKKYYEQCFYSRPPLLYPPFSAFSLFFFPIKKFVEMLLAQGCVCKQTDPLFSLVLRYLVSCMICFQLLNIRTVLVNAFSVGQKPGDFSSLLKLEKR